jgi:hypothetical protein
MKHSSIGVPTLLAAAVLALALQGRAQNVYSLNVVGYYNVPVVAGWNLLSVQLGATNYNANHVLGTGVDGALLYRFNPTNQTYYDAGTYFQGFGWCPVSGDREDPVLNLPLGESFFIWSPSNWIATFVGEVMQGRLVVPLPAYYSLKASIVPQAGQLQNDLLFPACGGDTVWKGVGSGFPAYFYDDWDFYWMPTEPTVDVGRGFFLYRDPWEATPDHWWVRNFTVQKASVGFSGPRIAGLSIQNGSVSLAVKSAPGSPYSVQFSADQASWLTVATSQTAALWQEPARDGAQGFYRLVNP